MRALIVLVIVGAASIASAEPKPGSKAAIAEAQKHYKQGEAFLELARQSHDPKVYDNALAEFEESYRLSLLPDVVYYIAQVYREKGDDERALDRYEKFVDLKPTGELADKAREWIASLRVAKQRRDEEARQREEARKRAEAQAELQRQADLAAAAERARQDELRRRQEEEQRKRQEEERKRQEEQQRRQDEIRQRIEAEQAARALWDADRDKHKTKRRTGYKWAGTGVGLLAVSLTCLVVGNLQYNSVSHGGLATANDIRGAISTGQALNGVAAGAAILGGIAVAIGTPMIAANWDKGEFKTAASSNVVGLVVSGTFR